MGTNPTPFGGGASISGTNAAGAVVAGTGSAAKYGTVPQVSKPANPTGNTGTSLLMCGCAVAFTPTGSGIALVVITCGASNSAVGSNNTVGARFGTGTAPVNGAAVTGTRIGPSADPVVGDATTAFTDPVTFTDVLTLVPGTAYWFDLCQASSAATTVTLVNLTFSIVEL